MSDVYDEGWNARYNDRGREDNPYPLNSCAHSDWDLGWYEADYFYAGYDEVGFTAIENPFS